MKYVGNEGRLCSSTCERLSVERMRERDLKRGELGRAALFQEEEREQEQGEEKGSELSVFEATAKKPLQCGIRCKVKALRVAPPWSSATWGTKGRRTPPLAQTLPHPPPP